MYLSNHLHLYVESFPSITVEEEAPSLCHLSRVVELSGFEEFKLEKQKEGINYNIRTLCEGNHAIVKLHVQVSVEGEKAYQIFQHMQDSIINLSLLWS